MEERHLRQWLKNTYCGRVKWIEPAYGSSVGLPDAEIPVGDTVLPVELKIGWIGRGSALMTKIRPSQYHYHIMEAERGHCTALMVAVGVARRFDVFLFEGKYCENELYRTHHMMVAQKQKFTEWGDCGELDKIFRRIMGMQPCSK